MLCSQQQQHSPSSGKADSGGGAQAAFPCPDNTAARNNNSSSRRTSSPLTCQEEMLPTCMSTAGTAQDSMAQSLGSAPAVQTTLPCPQLDQGETTSMCSQRDAKASWCSRYCFAAPARPHTPDSCSSPAATGAAMIWLIAMDASMTE